MKPQFVNFLSVFTSTGTLLCCALPAALAAIAGGAAVEAKDDDRVNDHDRPSAPHVR